MLMCFQFYGVFWGVSLAEEDKDGGCVAFVGTGEIFSVRRVVLV